MDINDYDYKPSYRKLPKNTLLFGVELEISHKELAEANYDPDEDSKLQDIADRFDPLFGKHSILKHDGSVDAGFEIVTHPLTFAGQQEFWTEDKFNFLDKQGFISYNAEHCGIHIHVTRHMISSLQLAKIIKFIYNRDNRPFIKKIAQREEKQYAEFSERKNCGYVKHGGCGKYTAVNLSHKNTIEFRLFRGTLSHQAFHKNLEFVQALIDFCSPALFSVKETEIWWNFINYVFNNKDKYKNLWTYAQSKEMDSIDNWNKHVEERKLKKEEEKLKKQKSKEAASVLIEEHENDNFLV